MQSQIVYPPPGICGTPFLIERSKMAMPAPQPLPQVKLTEDHLALKMLACIPVIGRIFIFFVTESLENKYTEGNDSLKKEISELSIQYLKIGIYQDVVMVGGAITLFATVAAVSFVALDIFIAALCNFTLVAVFISHIAEKLKNIRELNAAIKKFEYSQPSRSSTYW